MKRVNRREIILFVNNFEFQPDYRLLSLMISWCPSWYERVLKLAVNGYFASIFSFTSHIHSVISYSKLVVKMIWFC